MIGASLDELSPTTIQTWADLAHPDDMARSTTLLQAHFAGETAAYECEARMRHRDGHWIWVLDRGKVLSRTADGQPEWMFGTHLDITARKVQEDRLRKSEELLNRTGALAQVGGWDVDIASGSIQWSEQTCRIHGVEPGYQPQLAEAIDFCAPEARPVIEAAVAQAVVDGYGWDLELPLIQKGGQRIWVRAVGQAEFEGGQPVRLFGAFQDITQRVQGRQALEAAQHRVTLATDSGGIGIWERDLKTNARCWDSRTYQLFGLQSDCGDDPEQTWRRRVHPDDEKKGGKA
jgi:PAS domain S-box-containing protein